MKKQFLSLAYVFLLIPLFAQTTRIVSIPVASQVTKTVIKLNGEVNSTMGGRSRTVVAINLPANTVEWHYSFSTRSDGTLEQNLNLASQITSLITSVASGGSTAALFTGLPKSVVNSIFSPTGSVPVNAYVISSYEQSNFLGERDFNYYPGVSSTDATNAVVQVSNYNLKSGLFYLGFQNLSKWKGAIIDVEIVAIVVEQRQEAVDVAPNSNSNETYGKLIFSKQDFVGSWRDENSSFTLTSWGDIYIKWDNGQTSQGKWLLNGNLLNFDFSTNRANRYKGNDFYTIISFSGVALKCKSVGTQQIFNATKTTD